MNKEMKRSFRIFILKILAVAFCAVHMLIFYMQFVYRAKNGAAHKSCGDKPRCCSVYTAGGQKQMLSQKEEFSYFAFDGREKEKEYGTYVIPGLKNTRTLLTKKGCHSCHVYIHDASGTGGYRGLCAGQRLLQHTET